MPNRWFAGITALVFPSLSFLYLSKLRWMAVYLALTLVTVAVDIALSVVWWGELLFICSQILAVIAVIHTVVISKSIRYEKRRWFNRWWGISAVAALLAMAIVSFRSFGYEPFHLPSGSMESSYMRGD